MAELSPLIYQFVANTWMEIVLHVIFIRCVAFGMTLDITERKRQTIQTALQTVR
jgi:membrane protein insertase Oxa1/YidC/SpoIIIJ